MTCLACGRELRLIVYWRTFYGWLYHVCASLSVCLALSLHTLRRLTKRVIDADNQIDNIIGADPT